MWGTLEGVLSVPTFKVIYGGTYVLSVLTQIP